MRKIQFKALLAILTIAMALPAFVGAANKETMYYDEDGYVVQNKGQATYYRELTKKGSKYEAKDFYVTGEKFCSGTIVMIDYDNYNGTKWDGNIKKYYRSGELLFEGKYRMGYPEGEHYTYFERKNKNEKELRVKSVKRYDLQGELDGQAVSYYENGNIEELQTYKHGLADGEYLAYYEDGTLKRKGAYQSDMRHGNFITFYESGKMKEVGRFYNDELDGRILNYYESGIIKSVFNMRDGELHGDRFLYFENGQLSDRQHFKDDKADGMCVSYHENGMIAIIGTFKNNEMNGTFRWFDENGKKTDEGNYVNGKRQNSSNNNSNNLSNNRNRNNNSLNIDMRRLFPSRKKDNK